MCSKLRNSLFGDDYRSATVFAFAVMCIIFNSNNI